MAVQVSNEKELIWEDIKRWLKNIFVFSIPSIIVFLGALQQGADLKTAALALYGAMFTPLIDLLRKFQSETKYSNGTVTKISDPIDDVGK